MDLIIEKVEALEQENEKLELEVEEKREILLQIKSMLNKVT